MTDPHKSRAPKKSRIQIYGFHMSSCGYCKRKRESSCSYGVVAASLAAEDYLRMMMIGWRRRFGTYLYKPAMHVTCCPQYTIRLEASRFAMNKSQRQVLRRVERYLNTGTVLADSTDQRVAGKKGALTSVVPEGGNSKVGAAVHTLTTELVPAENTEERFELYRKYQVSCAYAQRTVCGRSDYVSIFLVAIVGWGSQR